MTEEELTESAREHFEERAGILEFEAGLPRDESERLAMQHAKKFQMSKGLPMMMGKLRSLVGKRAVIPSYYEDLINEEH